MIAETMVPLNSSTARLGLSISVTSVEALTRTQIVQYAGASGDFNPLHTDEPYAVEQGGFSRPVAHGMLTMGVAGRAITDWVGQERLSAFGVRFLAPVFPGDRLTTSLTISALEHADSGLILTLDIETTSERGPVIRGSATATID
ncbi:MAG: MaoC family dehydratase [Mycetocola sp.]